MLDELLLEICFLLEAPERAIGLEGGEMGVESLWRSRFNPKTEIEPRISQKGTDEERVMETIFKPVWCILKSVKIRVI